MQTTISTKGQVVLPSTIRRKLGLRAGDPLDAKIEGERIVLTPRRIRSRKVAVVADPITGLPVLSAGSDAPPLSSKQVRELLAEFP
jgi:AbrB family looped-hinge helix DNA binding protein